MEEYEVKVHVLEDMEEGEVTSDEEGEIRGKLSLVKSLYLSLYLPVVSSTLSLSPEHNACTCTVIHY